VNSHSPNPKNYQLSNDGEQDRTSFLAQLQARDAQSQDWRRNSSYQTNQHIRNQIIMKDQMKSFDRQSMSID
jgi:hypothetical protein